MLFPCEFFFSCARSKNVSLSLCAAHTAVTTFGEEKFRCVLRMQWVCVCQRERETNGGSFIINICNGMLTISQSLSLCMGKPMLIFFRFCRSFAHEFLSVSISKFSQIEDEMWFSNSGRNGAENAEFYMFIIAMGLQILGISRQFYPLRASSVCVFVLFMRCKSVCLLLILVHSHFNRNWYEKCV